MTPAAATPGPDERAVLVPLRRELRVAKMEIEIRSHTSAYFAGEMPPDRNRVPAGS